MQLTQNSGVFAMMLLAAALLTPQLGHPAGPRPLDSKTGNIDENSTLELHIDMVACPFENPDSGETEFSGRSMDMMQSSIAGGVIVKKQPGECNGMVPAAQNRSKADIQENSTAILASAFLKD